MLMCTCVFGILLCVSYRVSPVLCVFGQMYVVHSLCVWHICMYGMLCVVCLLCVCIACLCDLCLYTVCCFPGVVYILCVHAVEVIYTHMCLFVGQAEADSTTLRLKVRQTGIQGGGRCCASAR